MPAQCTHQHHLPTADTCDPSKTKMLVNVVGKGNYTYTATANGSYYMICTVGSHCTSGNMKQKLTVTGC